MYAGLAWAGLFIPDPDGEDEETRVGITTADALEAKVRGDLE